MRPVPITLVSIFVTVAAVSLGRAENCKHVAGLQLCGDVWSTKVADDPRAKAIAIATATSDEQEVMVIAYVNRYRLATEDQVLMDANGMSGAEFSLRYGEEAGRNIQTYRDTYNRVLKDFSTPNDSIYKDGAVDIIDAVVQGVGSLGYMAALGLDTIPRILGVNIELSKGVESVLSGASGLANGMRSDNRQALDRYHWIEDQLAIDSDRSPPFLESPTRMRALTAKITGYTLIAAWSLLAFKKFRSKKRQAQAA